MPRMGKKEIIMGYEQITSNREKGKDLKGRGETHFNGRNDYCCNTIMRYNEKKFLISTTIGRTVFS